MRIPSFEPRALLTVFKTIGNPVVFLLDIFGVKKGNIEYKIRNTRIKMIARAATPDHYEILGIFAGQEYDLHIVAKEKDLVIYDIGGHIGCFSVYASFFFKDCTPSMFIYEPAPNNFEYLEKNLAYNLQLGSYKLFNSAIASTNGKVKLNTSVNNNAYTIATSDGDSYIECDSTSLMSAAEVNRTKIIDILKLDIEGGEYLLLQHEPTINFIKKSVNYIFIEVHDTPGNPGGVPWVKSVLGDTYNVLYENYKLLYLKRKHII